MIDFVKIKLVSISVERLLESDMLEFKNEFSEKTGEISCNKRAFLHHCKISIKNNKNVEFSGSIHKFYNSLKRIKAPIYRGKIDKGFNGNQFTLSNIYEVRSVLMKIFNCNSNQMLFQNIEFGINTNPDFDPQIFIKSLLYHRGKEFEFRFNKQYAQVDHQRYFIKIYNKSKQYALKKNTLRIEIKHSKYKDFEETGIKSFEDVNGVTLDNALNLVLRRFDEVVYCDSTIDKSGLTERQKSSLKDYSRVNYWLHDLNSNKRDKHKKKLILFNKNFSNNLHLKLRKEVLKKGVIINRLSKMCNGVIINSSSIELNVTSNRQRICPVTKLDISMQKESSFLLSNSGLKYYEREKYLIFKKLVSVLLTGRSNLYEKDIYSKLSKQIRNKYYNNTFKYISVQQNLFK